MKKLKKSKNVITFLKAALAEDIGTGDLTSEVLIPHQAKGDAILIAKQDGIFCGKLITAELIRQADKKITCHWFVRDGQAFKKGDYIFQLKGKVRSILKLERTLLNFLGHLSGIATTTRAFVSVAQKHGVKILDSRKTTPLWREVEKYAVRTGGGMNHRMGLYDEIFVKENHRPYGTLNRLERFKGNFIMEVRNRREILESLPFNPRVILLDNYSPEKLKKETAFMRKIAPHVTLEASGGVTLKNIRRYAASGVDQISIGSLTHSVKCVDFSLLINETEMEEAEI